MEGLAKNFDKTDLYFENFTHGIINIAIWLWRRRIKKLHPNCDITILRFPNFVRLIATEPEHCECNKFEGDSD